MASWTLTTSGSAIAKAGAFANTTIIASGSTLQQWSDDAEGYIVSATRRDWVGSYTSLSTDIKRALSSIASALVAKQIISYDMSGYPSSIAETILNIQDDVAREGLNILKDFKSNDIKTP